jgi:LuxR family maltose regulon positive regulatory protein
MHSIKPVMMNVDMACYPIADKKEPIRIYTLGRFSVKTDHHDDVTRKKSKPLELLKAIIAHGGRQVSCEKIMTSLWPYVDGDCARRSFDTTLHRLRRLLGDPRAISLHNGLLTLDTDRVWVDAWAFDRLAGQILKLSCQGQADLNQLIRQQNELLEYYQGPFLGQEYERPWTLGYRERLHQRLVRALHQLGDYWIQHKMWDVAIACYEYGIQTDPLRETFYQRLMQLYMRLNRHADTAEIYQRCRKALAFNLGVTPSGDTIALYRQCAEA